MSLYTFYKVPFWNWWNRLIIKKYRVKCGSNVNIEGRIYVFGNKNSITIGDNSIITSSVVVNPTTGKDHCYFHVKGDGKISIGNNVGMSNVCITAAKSVVIEDNVLLGSGVKIWDTDFHSISYVERINTIEEKSFPVVIKEGAFIGAECVVLKGVTIGKHSVIGAGSIVTKNIPDNEVWAGNPAKFIKKINN